MRMRATADYGAPNIALRAPEGSFIDASAFESTSALASHLREVSSNKTMFDSYHAFRYKPLPQWFTALWNFTRVHSECRTCQWAANRLKDLNSLNIRTAAIDVQPLRQTTVAGGVMATSKSSEPQLDPMGTDTQTALRPKLSTWTPSDGIHVVASAWVWEIEIFRQQALLWRPRKVSALVVGRLGTYFQCPLVFSFVAVLR